MSATFTVTAEHMARTMETTRVRERQKIVRELEDHRDMVRAMGNEEAALALDSVIETVSPSAPRTAAATPPEEGDGLPPHRHIPDDEEATFLARKYGSFGG